MKKHTSGFLTLLLLFPLLLSSCLKNKEEDLHKQELDKLKKYITEHNITVAPTASGLYIVPDSTGEGVSPVVGDYVDFDYTLRRLDGEEVVITTDSAVASQNSLYSGALIYGPERLRVGSNITGLDEGLQHMREGGIATLIMPSDIAWGTNPYSPVGSYSSVIIKINLYRVLSDPAAYESSLIDAFLADSAFSADTLASGVFLVETQAGTSDTLVDLDRLLSMNIKGSLMDGRVFFPARDVSTTVTTSSSTLFTEGLVDGLKHMTVGEKAIILVPYDKGYTETGKYRNDGATKVPIPPYAALKYEVEIKDN